MNQPQHNGSERRSDKHIMSRGQQIGLILLCIAIAYGMFASVHLTVISLIACTMIFWIVFVAFKMILWMVGTRYSYPGTNLVSYSDQRLPTYTIFVALLHESDLVVTKLVKALSRLQYPKDKLQILLLLEADDKETQKVVREMSLPSYYEVVILPPPQKGDPRTKPRALNYGLGRATGELCVIYDAEDRPDPNQLLKAASAFMHRRDHRVVCYQARLRFWNETTNLMTRFYWAEYITHFEWVLAGLARLNLVPPLGGTSNHFQTAAVREVQGWDKFNVTEDAEIAAALACQGYRIDMLDSTTFEEATADALKADRYRSRYTRSALVRRITIHLIWLLSGFRKAGCHKR